VSLAKPHCWNSLQRLQNESLADSFPGSFMLNPWILRSKRLQWLNNLSGKHLNSCRFCARRLTSPSRFRGLKQPCDLGLCKSDHVAKIAASPGCSHPTLTDVSSVTPPTPGVRNHTGFNKEREPVKTAGLQPIFSKKLLIRAEAGRGYFPPLILRCIALAMPRRIALQVPGIAPLRSDAGLFAPQHQTGPP
jgi:hypothetical protein